MSAARTRRRCARRPFALCLDGRRAMTLFPRLFCLIWGADVDRALRPVLAISFAGSCAFSAGWSYLGIWAIKELGATSSQLAVGFLLGAIAAAGAGYLGG